MATARLQYRNDGFVTISNIGRVVEISAPTWRAKRWGVKQLKREAAALRISLKKQNGAFYTNLKDCNVVEYQLLPALQKCWVSPTNSDLRKAFGFRGRNILDKGF